MNRNDLNLQAEVRPQVMFAAVTMLLIGIGGFFMSGCIKKW